MTIDLSGFSSSLFWWISVVIGLLIVFVILKFFLHLVGHLIELLWRGCMVVALIVIVYFILRALGVI